MVVPAFVAAPSYHSGFGVTTYCQKLRTAAMKCRSEWEQLSISCVLVLTTECLSRVVNSQQVQLFLALVEGPRDSQLVAQMLSAPCSERS